MSIIITGAAGFIGYHLSKRILMENIPLVGIDNMNDYYDINLKKARLQDLQKMLDKVVRDVLRGSRDHLNK